MPTPTLPPELENIIINLFQDDHQMLKVCSLVCRNFPIYPSPTARLRRVLVSSPHIASYIKSLDIIDNWAVRIPEEERFRIFLTTPGPSENWVSCDADLTYILESIKNLDSIAFSSAGRRTAWHTLPLEMQDAIRGIFTSCRLIRVVLKNTDQFPLSLIHTCPALQHLRLDGVDFGMPDSEGDAWTGEKTCLASLQISCGSSMLEAITNYILCSGCRLDISRLEALDISVGIFAQVYCVRLPLT